MNIFIGDDWMIVSKKEATLGQFLIIKKNRFKTTGHLTLSLQGSETNIILLKMRLKKVKEFVKKLDRRLSYFMQ